MVVQLQQSYVPKWSYWVSRCQSWKFKLVLFSHSFPVSFQHPDPRNNCITVKLQQRASSSVRLQALSQLSMSTAGSRGLALPLHGVEDPERWPVLLIPAIHPFLLDDSDSKRAEFLQRSSTPGHVLINQNELPSHSLLQGLALQPQRMTSLGTPKENAMGPVTRGT